MVKTQVQIPDELFARAKQVAASKEWSFAEIVRRGLEYMTTINRPERATGSDWRLPDAQDLGQPALPEDQWTEACHE